MKGELSTKNALICYGFGGITAFIGFFSRTILIFGWVVLFAISIFMTFSGDN